MTTFTLRHRALVLLALCVSHSADAQPSKPNTQPATTRYLTATLSGGCYWTMETVFEHTRGVVDVVSGMTGGAAAPRSYQRNPTGTLGAAESVRITYDPAKLSYADLLRVYFSAAHDPTQVDRQGPDVGARYRSVVWVADDAQRSTALAYIATLEQGAGKPKVATQVAPVADFHPVIDSEQDFAEKNPNHPYVAFWDRPRLEKYRNGLPDFFREREARR